MCSGRHDATQSFRCCIGWRLFELHVSEILKSERFAFQIISDKKAADRRGKPFMAAAIDGGKLIAVGNELVFKFQKKLARKICRQTPVTVIFERLVAAPPLVKIRSIFHRRFIVGGFVWWVLLDAVAAAKLMWFFRGPAKSTRRRVGLFLIVRHNWLLRVMVVLLGR
jgi:hypothetical protein